MEQTSIKNEGFVEKLEKLNSYFTIDKTSSKKIATLTNTANKDIVEKLAREIVNMDFVQNCITNFLLMHYDLYATAELSFVYQEYTEADFLFELSEGVVKDILVKGKFTNSYSKERFAKAAFIKYLGFTLKEIYAKIMVEFSREKYSGITVRILKYYVWFRTHIPGDIEIRDYTNAEIVGMLDTDYLSIPLFARKNVASTISSINDILNRIRFAFNMNTESIAIVSNDVKYSCEMFYDEFMPGIDKSKVLATFNTLSEKEQSALTLYADGHTYISIGESLGCSDVYARKLCKKAIDKIKHSL